jgi:hypothetical protein
MMDMLVGPDGLATPKSPEIGSDEGKDLGILTAAPLVVNPTY